MEAERSVAYSVPFISQLSDKKKRWIAEGWAGDSARSTFLPLVSAEPMPKQSTEGTAELCWQKAVCKWTCLCLESVLGTRLCYFYLFCSPETRLNCVTQQRVSSLLACHVLNQTRSLLKRPVVFLQQYVLGKNGQSS